MAYTFGDVLRLDSVADFEEVVELVHDPGTGNAELKVDAGGRTSENFLFNLDTGPGANSDGPYVYWRQHDADFRRNSLEILSSLMEDWLGDGRTLRFRICSTGTFTNMYVQGRASSSDSWSNIQQIGRWSYSNSRQQGDAIGSTLVCSQDGNWVDFIITIPDDYTEVRFRNTGHLSGINQIHTAFWQIELRHGTSAGITIDDPAETLLDPGQAITLEGDYTNTEGLSTSVTAETDLGALGTVTETGSANGTWEVEFTAPAGEVNAQTVTVTFTATDSRGGFVTLEQTFTIRGLAFAPVYDPERDFAIQDHITTDESLYGVWGDEDENIIYVVDDGDPDDNDDDEQALKAFVLDAKVRHSLEDIDLSGSGGTNDPRGLFGDDTYFWVVSGRTGQPAYGYQRANGSRSSLFYESGTAGAGITGDGTTVWVCYKGTLPGHLYAHNQSSRSLNSANDISQSDLEDAGLGEIGGLYSDGETLWLVDIDNQVVRAYTTATRERNPALDFALIAANSKPWGIWADSTHFYISDQGLKKLFAYAYNLFEISLPELGDQDIETGQEVNLPMPEAAIRGADNAVTGYSMSGLPSGLTYDEDAHAITGTAPASAGIHSVTLTATDNAGNTAELDFRVVVWVARPSVYPWRYRQVPTAQQFNDHISDFLDYYAGRDGVFRPYQPYRLPNVTPYAVLYLNADDDVVQLEPGEAGQVLYGQGASAAPQWEDYAGDAFDTEDWLISRFDDGDSDWSGNANATRQFVRSHSLGRIPHLFSWCFEYVGSSLDDVTGFNTDERVYFPFGVESSGQEDWEFVPRLLWASATHVGYEVARWPEQTESNANLAGFVFRHRSSGVRVLARNNQEWGLRFFLRG